MGVLNRSSKEQARNCWEFWNCEIKENCPAYLTHSGRECWMVTNPLNKESNCPRVLNKITHCWECEWYKKLNPEAGKK